MREATDDEPKIPATKSKLNIPTNNQLMPPRATINNTTQSKVDNFFISHLLSIDANIHE